MAIGAALLVGACAPALKEAPPLADLAGGGTPPRPDEVDALLLRAAVAYEPRDPEGVREAAGTYMRAAAGDPTRTEGLVGAAQAWIWLVDHEGDARTREADATSAARAAQWCDRIAHEQPACAYWLGAALGVQAREKPATGLSALPLIEEAFKRAAEKEPGLYGGAPDRALALLYLRAPSWPTGPGDPQRGLEHARKAVVIAADMPPNQLALAEALEAAGDRAGARDALMKGLERARGLVAEGDKDAPDWIREAEKSIQAADR